MILTIDEFVVENIFLCHDKVKLIVLQFLEITKTDTHTNDTIFLWKYVSAERTSHVADEEEFSKLKWNQDIDSSRSL